MPFVPSRSLAAPVMAGLLATLLAMPAAAQSGVYVRGGLSAEFAPQTRFTDLDCAATTPPALFGCGLGNDGRTLSAQGDFGFPVAIEGGVGIRLAPMFRAEGLLSYRGGTEFEGNANFIGTPDPQPVTAQVDSLTGLASPISTFRASAPQCWRSRSSRSSGSASAPPITTSPG